MSNQLKPDPQVYTSNVYIRKKLNALSLSDTEKTLDHILCETAEQYTGYISKEIRDAYCQAEKIHLLPSYLAEAVKAKAAEMFIIHNHTLNIKLLRLYELPETIIMEARHDS